MGNGVRFTTDDTIGTAVPYTVRLMDRQGLPHTHTIPRMGQVSQEWNNSPPIPSPALPQSEAAVLKVKLDCPILHHRPAEEVVDRGHPCGHA